MLRLFETGHCEGFKGGYHVALGLFATGAALYNAIAFCRRGERHLATNTLLYAALVAIEARKVRRHCGR